MLGIRRLMQRWRVAPYLAMVAAVLVSCCSSCVPLAHIPQTASDPWGKVTFDLGQLNEEGLRGPADGLRSLSHEFCIPNGERFRVQVASIDLSVQFICGSRGRIGCGQQSQQARAEIRNTSFAQVPDNDEFAQA